MPKSLLNYMTIIKKILIAIPSLLFLIFLTACGAPTEAPKEVEKTALEIKGQTVGESRSIKQEYEYPALVLSEQEAKLIAKTSGTAKQVNFKIGDKVKIGSLLVKIDDINQGGSLGQGFSASQIKQAQLAAEQAETNRRNLALTSAEGLKSLQITYESAKIAAEQAKLALSNREKGINQSDDDINTNVNNTANSVADTCNTIINGINNITGFDPSAVGDLPYKNNLGVTNSQQAIEAKNIYDSAESAYQKYITAIFADTKTRIDETIKLAESTKKLTDITKKYIDSSLVGTSLPAATLSGFQSAIAVYQTQINAAIAQINAAKQALENNTIANDTGSDALTKAYELAKQQEKNAWQALKTQQANIKSALDTADLGYRNALINLQSIMDIHLVVAPISGLITQSFVSLGDTVSAGELLATISSGQTMKFQLYVDESVLKNIAKGQSVIIKNNENKEIPGKIANLAAQADTLTKRFLVEVMPISSGANDFALGTVVNIIITVEKKSDSKNIILSLSAIEIGQNNTNIFIMENGRAKKIPVTIIKIQGETAEMKADLAETDIIITDGNKFIQEGDPVILIE